MSVRKQRLELTWIGKDERPHLEPRILLEDDDISYLAKAQVTDADIFDNILIQGDNLLALKALEQEFEGQIKCIYIDPPYNTGSAFRFYDDGVEHSLYLSLLRDRISILQRLLRKDGCLFVQADDNEGHYIKALCDEIFGRKNFIATFIWKKVDSPNDNKVAVTPDHEFIFAYAKSIENVALRQRPDSSLLDAYIGPDEEGRYYRDRLLKKNGKNSLRTDRPSMWFGVPGPDGKDVFPIHDDGREARWAMGKQSVSDALRDGTLIWKDRGDGDAPKWVPYTREYASENPSRPFPTLWTDLPTTRQTKAHQKELFGAGNEFDTPKPEALIERVFQVCTSPGDLVLDSFGGSGTTGAVAQKMGRRWIMVELGDHCETHIVPRLRQVIDGDDPGGITEAVQWAGGGGFRFYRLGPSLLEKDAWDNWVIAKEYYDPAKLTQAVCKLMGFVYQPDETKYWMQGRSSETDFIYVTTQSMTHEQLAAISEEVGDERTLLVCCKAFHANADSFTNLTVRKIPQAVLRKCEWGKDDYSLNVANLPEATRDPGESDLPPSVGKNGKISASQDDLFGRETGK